VTARRSEWTLAELQDELRNSEAALTRSGLKRNTIRTYVDRTEIFLRWLGGDYQPRGPVGP
jgi:hypothetical protein